MRTTTRGRHVSVLQRRSESRRARRRPRRRASALTRCGTSRRRRRPSPACATPRGCRAPRRRVPARAFARPSGARTIITCSPGRPPGTRAPSVRELQLAFADADEDERREILARRRRRPRSSRGTSGSANEQPNRRDERRERSSRGVARAARAARTKVTYAPTELVLRKRRSLTHRGVDWNRRVPSRATRAACARSSGKRRDPSRDGSASRSEGSRARCPSSATARRAAAIDPIAAGDERRARRPRRRQPATACGELAWSDVANVEAAGLGVRARRRRRSRASGSRMRDQSRSPCIRRRYGQEPYPTAVKARWR